MKEAIETEPPIMEIRGIRGQTLAGWRDNLLGPAVFAFATIGMLSVKDVTLRLILASSAFVLIAGTVLFRLSKGRIRLFADRVEMTAWNDAMPWNTRVVLFEQMRSVMLSGSTLTVVRHAAGKRKRRAYRLSIAAPVAEELFDEMVKTIEAKPDLPFRVEEKGDGKGSIRRLPEGLDSPA